MTTTRPLPSLAQVIFNRAKRVSVPQPNNGTRSEKAWQKLEQALGMTGMVLSRPLYSALHALSDAQLHEVAGQFLPVALSQYGVHKGHRTLFRHFPEQTPQDTYEFYLRRLIAFSLRDPQQPCALDGDDQPFGLSGQPSVTPQRACVYAMFDPEQFGGCPVCGRVVAGTVPQDLQESKERLQYFTVLHLDPDPMQTAREELTKLLARTVPLNPQEKDELRVLLAALGVEALPLLPAEVPQRETLALILGTLLANPVTQSEALARLDTHTKTATDLLRVLDVMGGGDATLLGPNVKPKLSRPLRRAFLARLEARDPRNLTEDLHRYPARWKRMGEALHPFEYAKPFPNVAVAFAALRGTTPQDDALGELLRGAKLDGLELVPERSGEQRTGPREALKKPDVLEQALFQELWRQAVSEWEANNWNGWRENYRRVFEQTQAQAKAQAAAQLAAQTRPNPAYATIPRPPRLNFTGWAGRVEKALEWGDTPTLLRLLSQRSGELGRRADKVLQVAGEGAVPVILEALPHLKTPMLLGLRAHLLARDTAWPNRLFFPKSSAQVYELPDTRPALDPALTLPIVNGITAELLRRAARLSRFPVAVLDERLKDLPIPFATRNAARSLVTLGRGASLELPKGRFARLFVHWMEYAGQRVDLDLSVAFFDKDWQRVGECTYYNLTTTGATHSGDFTSAPAPHGASEFIDLDVDALLCETSTQYVVMTVMSYNGIPFENMAEAFAGYMLREHEGGKLFDARAVEQRFDLRGGQQISVPLALDLYAGTLHWLDTTPKTKAVGAVVGNQVAAYSDELGHAARSVLESASVRARPTLWDLAQLHATARADAVWIRGADGVLRDQNDVVQAALPNLPTFGAFLFRDLELGAGSVAVSLREQVTDWAERMTFEELLDELKGQNE